MSSTSSSWRPNTHLVFWMLFSIHLAVALYLKFVVGIDIQGHPRVGSWDWFYHTVPTADLLAHPLRSIWFLHMQPPLFNLLGAGVMRLFSPNHLQALQVIYMAMGALTVAMSYVIALTLTRSVRLALVVALFLALNPAFFLFEAYILYDILTAFEVAALVWLLCVYVASTAVWRIAYLFGFVLLLALLTLTRSTFHLIFLPPALALACVMAGKQWKTLLVVGVCCALLPLGWYVKSYQQVGVFGGSSWMGISLWKIAAVRYSEAELAALAETGVIDRVVADLPPFSRPAAYRAYGFDKVATNAEWARDDFNNINIPAISQVYQANTLRLIAYDAKPYLRSVLASFFIFCNPASEFADIADNTVKIAQYERFYADLQGNYPFRRLNSVGSALVILLPIGLALYGVLLLQQCGFAWRRWAGVIRCEGPMIFTAYLVLYTLVTSSLLEFGENFRFKFMVEGPMWALLAAIFYRRYWRPPLIVSDEVTQDGPRKRAMREQAPQAALP